MKFSQLFFLGILSIQLSAQDTILISGLPDGQHKWSSKNTYTLTEHITLDEGILVIEPGTKILSRSKGISTIGLTINNGAQIIAEGTEDNPIVFQPDTQDSLWQGIRVNGSPPGKSNILKYVNIQGAGSQQENREGAALILDQLDSNAIIDHLEVFDSKGDGIRILGGTVNISFACISNVYDDAFEYDRGWTGNGIYWYAGNIGNVNNPAPVGSFAIEGNSWITDTDTLISNPRIYHATLIGEHCGGSSLGFAALGFLSGSQGTIANSVITHFNNYGIIMEDYNNPYDTYQFLKEGKIQLKNNFWWDFGRHFNSNAGNEFRTGEGGLIFMYSNDANHQAEALVSHLEEENNLFIGPLIRRNYLGTCLALDPRPELNLPYDQGPNLALPPTSFFSQYSQIESKGAFDDDIWFANWTIQADSAILGEASFGHYFFQGQKLQKQDTLFIDCGDLPWIQDSLYYRYPCDPFPNQLGAVHRKGNARRVRPRSREAIDFAWLEDWNYSASAIEDCRLDSLHLTIIVIDSTPPIIHPVPGTFGLSAIVDDCDEAWVTNTEIDTLNANGEISYLYLFTATDYSGNISTLEIAYIPSEEQDQIWYPDFDGDGFGSPNISINSKDSIPGYVRNNLDCNDSDPSAFPNSEIVPSKESNIPIDYACDGTYLNYDICESAIELEVLKNGKTCQDYLTFGNLIDANPTVFPSLSESCLPKNFADVWLKFKMPASGGIYITFYEEFDYLDDLGFRRSFSCEVYNGNCVQLKLLDCISFEDIQDYYLDDQNLIGSDIFLRVMETGNKNDSPFSICLLDRENKATNGTCIQAQEITINTIEECEMDTFHNFNADFDYAGSIPVCFNSFTIIDVWFQFTVPENDSFRIILDSIAGSEFTLPGIAFYGGDCNSLVELACFEAPNNDWITQFQPNERIFLQVFDYAGQTGSFQMNLCTSGRSVATNQFHIKEPYTLFPNPTSDRVYLENHGTITNILEIYIYDLQGKLALRTFPLKNPSSIWEINTQSLSAGIYFIKWKNQNHHFIKKLIISR